MTAARVRVVFVASVLVIGAFTFAVVALLPARYVSLTGDPGAHAHDVRALEGSVSELDAQTGVVHIAHGLLPFSTSTVTVAPEAHIRVHDRIGVLEDLRDGVRVRVCYEIRQGTRWARAVEVPPSQVPCRAVIAVATAERRATVVAAAKPLSSSIASGPTANVSAAPPPTAFPPAGTERHSRASERPIPRAIRAGTPSPPAKVIPRNREESVARFARLPERAEAP